MKNKFLFPMDGGEARMIVAALIDAAIKEKGLGRDMHRILARRIDEARQQWHEEAKKHIDARKPFGDINEHDAVMHELDAVKHQIASTIEEGETE